jgi:hypothetical protein
MSSKKKGRKKGEDNAQVFKKREEDSEYKHYFKGVSVCRAVFSDSQEWILILYKLRFKIFQELQLKRIWAKTPKLVHFTGSPRCHLCCKSWWSAGI